MPLMTREQLRVFLIGQGFPIGKSTLDKLCAPTVNLGPPIEGWWGNRPLHNPERGLEWAKKRLRPSPSNLVTAT